MHSCFSSAAAAAAAVLPALAVSNFNFELCKDPPLRLVETQLHRRHHLDAARCSSPVPHEVGSLRGDVRHRSFVLSTVTASFALVPLKHPSAASKLRPCLLRFLRRSWRWEQSTKQQLETLAKDARRIRQDSAHHEAPAWHTARAHTVRSFLLSTVPLSFRFALHSIPLSVQLPHDTALPSNSDSSRTRFRSCRRTATHVTAARPCDYTNRSCLALLGRPGSRLT